MFRLRYGFRRVVSCRCGKVGARLDVEVDFRGGRRLGAAQTGRPVSTRCAPDLHEQLAPLGKRLSMSVGFTADRRWATLRTQVGPGACHRLCSPVCASSPASMPSSSPSRSPRQTGSRPGSLLMLDPSTAPGGEAGRWRRFQAVIAARLAVVPPLRWRLVEVPFRAGTTVTGIDDPDFDLGLPRPRSWRWPAPGTDCDARRAGRPDRPPGRWDRARPLWEIYLLHGRARRPDGRAHQDPPCVDRRYVRPRKSWARCWTLSPEIRPC